MSLPKFNFVIDYSDSELFVDLSIDTSRGDHSWCLQTYNILSKRSKLPVQISNRLIKDAVNIVHSDRLFRSAGEDSKFIVCVRADFPRRPWAHYHLVQNKNQLGKNTSFIPHWIQPGLIKRCIEREGVKRVGYAGQTFNGNLAGTTTTWKKLFEPHGIEFVTLSEDSWHDLSSIDVLIGIRSFDTQPHNNKPPTKLFNAWHANIPFVGGHDSAFKQIGTPGENYLLAETPQEAIDSILRLQKDPELYARIVDKGKQKASLFTEHTIADIWKDVLTGPVMERYKLWNSRRTYENIRYKILLNVGRLEHESKQLIKKVVKMK